MTLDIYSTLKSFDPVGLGDIDKVRLMNRVDTKYLLSSARIPELLERMDGDYSILEINGERMFSYNTTYLDTQDYLFFGQHVTCRPERYKVRYRTYVSSGTTFLEVKHKTNKKRTIKWRIENCLTDLDTMDSAALEFINRHVPGELQTLKPVLRNEFNRITFIGKETEERITLDMNLSFTDNGLHHISLPSVAVIELKKDNLSVKSTAANILKDLSGHPCGFSKYCVGVSILCDAPKKNMVKSRLLLINKIENEISSSVCA